MKKFLLDANIVLDVLLERQPHFAPSAAVWVALESGSHEAAVSAHALTTIHYMYRKHVGSAASRRSVAAMLRVFSVAAVDGTVIQDALRLSMPDFEDSVTAAAADMAGCDFIVTWDLKGFQGSPVRSIAPEAVLPLLNME